MKVVDRPVVEPLLDDTRVMLAERLNRARAQLLRSGTAVTVEQVARATGRPTGTVRRWVARRRNAAGMVTVQQGQHVLIPTFQLSDSFDIDEGAARVVARLVAAGLDGWSVWEWALRPTGWLNDRTPAARLAAGDVDAVMHAVDGLLQE